MTLPPGIAPTGEPQTFEEYQLRVNPTREALSNLAAQPDETPIIMLNLLRFNPRGDSTVYGMYAKVAAPEVLKTNSIIGYYGRVLAGFDAAFGFDETWDGIVMPVYRGRRSFLDLQKSPVYQRAIPFRTAGASARTLYVLKDGDKIFAGSDDIQRLDQEHEGINAGSDEIFIADLLRFGKNGGREDFRAYAERILPLLERVSADPVLSLAAEVPVVSTEFWDHYTLTRFPSANAVNALYGSDEWQAAQSARRASLENSLTIPTATLALPK